MHDRGRLHSTTIVGVRRAGAVALGGDGQVSLGNTIVKRDACKIRRLHEGRVLCGFAGSAADAFALMDRFEAALKQYSASVPRAAVELAKQWRLDRALRRLESMLVVCDAETLLVVGGQGEVIEPTDGVVGIGSGGPYALAAARALMRHTDLGPAEICRRALEIAAEICVYSNDAIHVEHIPAAEQGR